MSPADGRARGGGVADRVSARPYDFPHDGGLGPEASALVCIDMQRDFIEPGGYFDAIGIELAPFQRVIAPIEAVLAAARARGYLVIHTRQGWRADLADLPEVVRFRSRNAGAEIGGPGPLGRRLVRGQPGHGIVAALAPLAGEPVIDKPGASAFHGTGLERLLARRRIRNLVLVGITTDVCVHGTLRSAIDRGYDCLLLADCTAASPRANGVAAIRTIQTEGGILGAVGSSARFIKALG